VKSRLDRLDGEAEVAADLVPGHAEVEIGCREPAPLEALERLSRKAASRSSAFFLPRSMSIWVLVADLLAHQPVQAGAAGWAPVAASSSSRSNGSSQTADVSSTFAEQPWRFSRMASSPMISPGR